MDIIWSEDVEDSIYDAVSEDFYEKSKDFEGSFYDQVDPDGFDEKSKDVEDSFFGQVVAEDFDEKSKDVEDSFFGQVVAEDFDEKSKDVGATFGHIVREDFDEKFYDTRSNDDERSWSYGSESEKSSKVKGNSRRGCQSDLSVLSKYDRSKSHPRCPTDRGPIADSEYRENGLLDLMSVSGLPMTQVNGQRKLGPPPGWTEPIPDPSCEVFVGKIPRKIYEHHIYPVFQKIGQVYEIRLMMDFSGTNRGYCFVMFSKFEYAQRAVRELNDYEIQPGRRIGVVASINNCRLCIGQLPTDIEPKIVIEKFYEITDEVSKVAVYKNMNGQVRCALVSYKTHRGAAMARRRLLPERTSLFGRAEVTIDWAHPDMSPNNVVEESGVLDEDGKLQISSVTINHSTKRGRSQKRGRCDFLDKSIKNYLQEKSAVHPPNPRKSPGGSSIRVQRSLGRGNSFQARRRGGRASSHQRKYFNPSPRGRGYNREPIEDRDRHQNRSRSLPICQKENSRPPGVSYSASRDINGNLMSPKNFAKNHDDLHDRYNNAPDNPTTTLRTDQAISRAQGMNPLAKNFVPETPCFNLFKQYALTSEKRAGNLSSECSYDRPQGPISRDGSVANFFRTFDTRSDGDIKSPTPKPKANERSANFAEYDKWNSTESFVPRLDFYVPTRQNDAKPRQMAVNEASERIKTDSARTATRNPRKNFRCPPANGNRAKNPPRVLNQKSNWNGNYSQEIQQRFQAKEKNQADSGTHESVFNWYVIPGPVPTLIYSQHRAENCCRECIDDSAAIQRRIQLSGVIAQQQRQQQVAPYCSQNDWRGSNCVVGKQSALVDHRRQLPNFVPQGCYPTSAFVDYYRTVHQQMFNDKNQIGYRPRPILNRFAAGVGEN